MAISDVPTTNSRHAFRRKVQELINVVNLLDPNSDGPSVLKTAVVNGAAANTNIAVSGITTSDAIQSVVAYTSGVPAVVSATIQSAGNIRSTSNTTDKVLVVNWLDQTP
jgi:hypothetical protein